MNHEFLAQFLENGAIVTTPGKKLLVGWGKRYWGKTPKDPLQPAFYFPDFFLNEPCPWFQHENYVVMSIESLLEELAGFQEQQPKKMAWRTAEFEPFHRAFEELQDCFKNKTLEKGVPFIFEKSKHAMDTQRLMESLRSTLQYMRDHPAYVYGYWSKQDGVLGATPEILFHRPRKQYDENTHSIIHSVACAGTCANKEDAEAFLNSKKNLHEHDVVVNGITSALKPYGKVMIGKRRLLRLPALTHLCTDIQFHPAAAVRFEELVKILHPTPALGAYPAKEGIAWLRGFYKNVDRKHYGAPIGYLMSKGKEAFCLVGIRNAQWNAQGTRIGAGCGIVEESIKSQEWEELQMKVRATKDILSL